MNLINTPFVIGFLYSIFAIIGGLTIGFITDSFGILPKILYFLINFVFILVLVFTIFMAQYRYIAKGLIFGFAGGVIFLIVLNILFIIYLLVSAMFTAEK